VFADGATAEDRALWVAPIIYRPNPTWTPTPSATPAADWPTFTNTRYGFAFKYPPPGPIIANNDTFATIHLPFVQGTVLQDKSLLVTAYENVNACMGAFPFPQTSENVTINGLPFLKQTGQDRGATYLFRWTSYSTLRNNVCVSLNFILDSLNPGTPATPPAAYDEASESAIFEQIVATYRWLEITPTATPTLSPTPTPSLDLGTLTGQVHAGKPVTLSLYRDNSIFVTSTTANADGTFNFTLPAGTYLLIARSDGFLGAQGFVTITAGNTSAIPVISLPPGDIDGNNLIDQYDVLTIGMNYNTGFPPAADLNNDGIINVLDLELLAQNYRKTGPVAWQ
ncbi:MAG TPA: carboxypeptidase regulatory-like domain-containing protein, partial [Anaerolineales bacterium]|nr:carboxypeptidase regulatory-like domain-containing protein [Anaerolineales bacterium]